MKKSLFYILCLVSLINLSAISKNVYVYDKAKVWSRTGPSDGFKVQYKLLPGTKLEVIGEDLETSYTQVRDLKQRVFWMKSEYLSSTPTANILLEDALNTIDKSAQSHQREVLSLEKQIVAMKPLESSNRELLARLAEMELEIERLTLSNNAMSGRFFREIYLAGGVTVLVGMFLGWIFGARRKKRSNAWD